MHALRDSDTFATPAPPDHGTGGERSLLVVLRFVARTVAARVTSRRSSSQSARHT